MDKYTDEEKLVIYKTAETLLKISYKLREKDMLPEIGKEVAILADKTLNYLEETEITVSPKVSIKEVEKSCGGECGCESDICNGHQDFASDFVNCNGHSAMGPDTPMEEKVMDFPSGNSSPEIDMEIDNLIDKIKGQING